MMTDVSSSRTVDMILQALFAYTTCANKPVRWGWTAVLHLYSHVSMWRPLNLLFNQKNGTLIFLTCSDTSVVTQWGVICWDSGVIRKSTISCESFSFNVLSLDMSHQIILPGIAMWRCRKMPSDVVLRTAQHLLQRQNKTKPKIYTYTLLSVAWWLLL